MTTAQQIFEMAIALMDAQSDAGEADTADNAEYKNRTLPVLNILRGELYPFSDTHETDEEGRPVAALIRSFEELKKVLESYGYKMERPHGGSSHCTFRKSGCSPITVPIHEPIKVAYVRMVKEVIESEGQNDENA